MRTLTTILMAAKIMLRSPLHHGAFGKEAGNSVLLRRMTLVAAPGSPQVPVISGNALRGVIRRVLMRDLFKRAGLDQTQLEGRRWDRLYAALANGGHLDGSENSVDPAAVRALREALPPLSVLGAALYSWMLPGHVSVGIAWPRCQETAAAGLCAGSDDLQAAEDLVEEVSHTRHIEREEHDPAKSGVTPMPVTMETVKTGAVFDSVLTFAPHASLVEQAAIAYALGLVQFLGGKAGAGLGAVAIEHDGDATPYADWLASTGQDELRTRLVALADRLE